ncbi:hypothetical protein MDA_GLEAN10002054 [Myotis davidii]|uniref:Uncharacterized protein n=1 Tax=Myotis davidii TaxID=225400 RepID=L5LQC3_MYODS|nr:hypothetical protein MDA_GLEAN10002054 [Myotis davidii]
MPSGARDHAEENKLPTSELPRKTIGLPQLLLRRQSTCQSVTSLHATNPIRFTKYRFRNSPPRCSFQLLPTLTGRLRAVRLRRAAVLFFWTWTNCSGLSGNEGGVPGSSCSTQAFLTGLTCKWSLQRPVKSHG